MNHANLIQAARGPVMLIALGILFAIDHSGQFSFARTWPLLIIIFGLLKLLEKTVARPEPYGQDVPGGGNPS